MASAYEGTALGDFYYDFTSAAAKDGGVPSMCGDIGAWLTTFNPSRHRGWQDGDP